MGVDQQAAQPPRNPVAGQLAVTRMGATLHRLDVSCAALGLPLPPAQADLKFVRNGQPWTLLLSCPARHAEAFVRWLQALGALEVLRGPPGDPVALRAGVPRLPVPCEVLLSQSRVDHVAVSVEGVASVIVRAREEEMPRLAALLEGGPAPGAMMPVLTKRQAELLRFCVARGYYSIPRRATLRRLSGELGISTTSLSLALRRAEGKIILAHVAHMGDGALPPAHVTPN